MAGPVGWCSPDNHTCDFMSHPFIKSISRMNTAPLLKGFGEGWLVQYGLGARVEWALAGGEVLRPTRYQSPAGKREIAASRPLTDDANRLRGRNVISWLPLSLTLGLKVILDHLLAARETITATHRTEILALPERRQIYQYLMLLSLCWLIYIASQETRGLHPRLVDGG